MRNTSILLRIEALCIFLIVATIFYVLNYHWLWFVGLFLVPDISAIGYLKDEKVGAWMYNIAHTYTVPIALLVLALLFTWSFVVMCALIWIGHIALDRVVGYGLKEETFKKTHLQ